MYKILKVLSLFLFISVFISCSQNETLNTETLTWETARDTTDRIQNISGFSGPEAVRYDPEQDVYFVSNFAGEGNDRDANGFISKLLPDGTIDSLQFMTGTNTNPMHAPRGMYFTGDTLWAADADGIHGFNRMTGEQVQFIDFTEFEPGFLNDIAADSEDNLFITDTGTSRLFKVEDNRISVISDSLPHQPNGITLDPSGNQLVLAPWGGDMTFHAWNMEDESLNEFSRAGSGGNFDGIEFVNGRLIAASQQDSSLHVIDNGEDYVFIKLSGRPADIGIDTERNQVAIPFVDLNRVDIWQLPGN